MAHAHTHTRTHTHTHTHYLPFVNSIINLEGAACISGSIFSYVQIHQSAIRLSASASIFFGVLQRMMFEKTHVSFCIKLRPPFLCRVHRRPKHLPGCRSFNLPVAHLNRLELTAPNFAVDIATILYLPVLSRAKRDEQFVSGTAAKKPLGRNVSQGGGWRRRGRANMRWRFG